MTIDAFLSQYRTLVLRIERRKEHLHRMTLQLDAISSSWGEHLSEHRNDAPYVRMLERIETLRGELKADSDILPYLTEQIMDLIYSLPEEKMKKALAMRYLDGKSYRQIADFMFLDRSTVQRYIMRALARLNVPDEPILIGT